jgi:amino acid transporter
VVAVSTFALLFTYSITNISAFKLKGNLKRQKVLAMLGLATCIMLLVFILFASTAAWIIGVAFLIAGTAYYAAWKKFRQVDGKKAV